jgi:hypothetical protein
MIKSASLIGSALLVFGLAAGSMAADMPKSAAPTAADAGAPTTDTAKPATHKHKTKRAARANKKAKKAATNTDTANK